ncbi:acyl carrier protein [Reyranella sp.]|uniref:acyl carrier protein n=1 Tax=Reyranella sp. TaxID=1929291 RepID=UPI003BA9702B
MQSPNSLAFGAVEHVTLQLDILREIRRYLTPYQTREAPITGQTVISDGATIDSLTLMDMLMELEDRFDVSIPTRIVAEVRTVDQLADAIVALRAAG